VRRSLRATATWGVALLVVCTLAPRSHAQVLETLGEVRVHGNHTTPDADVLAIANLQVGTPVDDEVLRQAGERLRRSGRFADVELRKRYRTLDDPTDILVIVLVDEHAAVSRDDLTPGPLKRLRSTGMWLPILDYTEGYGLTYGLRVSFMDTIGPRSRVSVPLSWGGERRAAVEAERIFDRGPITRLQAAVSRARRLNPHFDQGDTRNEAVVRVERAVTPWLRIGGGGRLADVRFGIIGERLAVPAVEVVLDTRIDPAFPRNAIHVNASLEQLRFGSGRHVARRQGDLRAYVGLTGTAVLALRAVVVDAAAPLPPYEQALLGGTSILRGYRFGYRADDNLAALSAEVRVPLTSPLSISRFGVRAFADAGTVYPATARLSDQRFDQGVGGGVFFTAAIVRAGFDVAWPLSGPRTPRWHFGLGLTF
jgi:hypothetical protein